MNIDKILSQIIQFRQKIGANLVKFDISYKKNQINATEIELIELLESVGIDTDFNDIKIENDKTFSYKGRRVLIYIRDVENYNGEYNLRKFHIFHCETIKNMTAQGRQKRYVVASRDDGIFNVNFIKNNHIEKSEEKRLDICQNCLNRLNARPEIKKLNLHFDKKNFSLKEFFSLFAKDFIDDNDHLSDIIAPLNQYPDAWRERTRYIREEAKWICQKCELDCSQNRSFLDTHHINGIKSDLQPSNLIALCKRCHANEPNHGHYKKLLQDKGII